MRISLVPRETVSLVWPDVERVLTRSVATANGKAEVIDVLHGVFDGTYVLWVVLDDGDNVVAAFTTRLIVYPRRRAIALDWIGGGRMKEWSNQLVDVMTRYAKELNCQHLEGYGRKGWSRFFDKRHGVQQEYIAYRMELEDGQQNSAE
jgi:hypothetical protein